MGYFFLKNTSKNSCGIIKSLKIVKNVLKMRDLPYQILKYTFIK